MSHFLGTARFLPLLVLLIPPGNRASLVRRQPSEAQLPFSGMAAAMFLAGKVADRSEKAVAHTPARRYLLCRLDVHLFTG